MTPPTRLQILTQFLICYRQFFAKQEPFRISEVIGGVMTPPYEVLRNSPTNGSSNISPRERTGRSEMCNEYRPTTSLEIVSGHRPPVPKLSADTVRPTNESLNISPRERTGRSERCNEYRPTTSLEIVSGHRPPVPNCPRAPPAR